MNRFAKRIKELTDPDVDEINRGSQSAASEADLQDLEKKLGVSLPEDYREFLHDYGGMWLADNSCRRAAIYHLHNSQRGRACVGVFYTLEELLGNARSQWNESYIAKDLIEIAENGNVRLYLAVSGDWQGTIYQWYPNLFPERLHYYPDLEVIARSFGGFLEMLNPRDHEEDEEIEQVVRHLGAVKLPSDNIYTPKMESLNARYVYSTLGEETHRLSEQDFRDLEEALGYNLPLDYREFLRDFGGYSFLLEQGSNVEDFPEFMYETRIGEYIYPSSYWVRFFHGLIHHDFHSFCGHFERLREVLPEGIIPIADGGSLCLGLAGADAGTVYISGKEISDYTPDEPPTRIERSALIPLASSFDEFVNALVLP